MGSNNEIEPISKAERNYRGEEFPNLEKVCKITYYQS